MTQKKESGLYELLRDYSAEGIVPFHMPGHKRRFHLIEDPYAVDITEITGFDDLHHAEGILKEAQEAAETLLKQDPELTRYPATAQRVAELFTQNANTLN